MKYARDKINGKHEHIYAILDGLIVGHVCTGIDDPDACLVGFRRIEEPCPFKTRTFNFCTPQFIAREILDMPICEDRQLWDQVWNATQFPAPKAAKN